MTDYGVLKNITVSEHFTAFEVAHSANHPELVTIPTPEILYHASMFACGILEPIRHFAADDTPIAIDSWYRNPRLNREVGGVPHSIHQIFYKNVFQGVAADIVPRQKHILDVFAKIADEQLLRKVPMLEKIIIYPKRGFIHLNSATSNKLEFYISMTKGKYEQVSLAEAKNIRQFLKDKFNHGG